MFLGYTRYQRYSNIGTCEFSSFKLTKKRITLALEKQSIIIRCSKTKLLLPISEYVRFRMGRR